MKINYRPELDGLRAIAVISVILYHSQISLFGHKFFTGGFIGVDIFFVISGYLITSIILTDLHVHKNFSFKNFYERRVRRILPALIFVMLVSTFLAWHILLPLEIIDFSKSIIFSLLFNSNFYFWFSGYEYGLDNQLLRPFLHTWSLSVEEQFYIIFPILLFCLYKYQKNKIIHLLLIGFIFSLCLAEWSSKNYPIFNYYSLVTRVWELLAGSILAYFEIIKKYKCANKKLNYILPIIGLLLIFYFILFFDNQSLHPSFLTMFPITGVCLIIWFSSNYTILTKILSSKIFVSIGLISYSLYLWHFPIFAFARVSEFIQGNFLNKVFVGIVLLLISIFSYHFIEQPFRNKKNNFKTILTILTLLITILFIINFNIIYKDGHKERLPKILQKNISPPWNLLRNNDGDICFENINGCKFNTHLKRKIYLIGDSHAAAISYDLKKKATRNNFQFITYNLAGCLYYPGFDLVNSKTLKVDGKCTDNYFQKIKKILSQEKDAIIIFAGRYPLYLSNKFFDNKEGGIEGGDWENKYISLDEQKTIQSIFKEEVLKISKNNKVLLLYPIPEIGWRLKNKIFLYFKNMFSYKNPKLENITTSYEVFKNRTKLSFEELNKIKGKNIYKIFPHKLFCNTTVLDRCIVNSGEISYYFDDDHPSLEGSKLINELIFDKIKKFY